MTQDCDIAVVGGGLGGVAAALAALRRGRRVVLTEEYPWLGGQLTSQGVPPDEHPWIEQFGATASYRALREAIRDYYRRYYPLTPAARQRVDLNPGAGWVSKLCHEPRVAAAVIDAMLAPYESGGALRVLRGYRPVAADTDGDRVVAVTVAHVSTGDRVTVTAPYILDATEAGDLLPLTATEYVTGFESQADTGEPSAPGEAQPDNWQGFSWCFALDHVPGDHTIDRPANYQRWREYQPPFWPAPLLSLTWPDPRTLNPLRGAFEPNPGDDPLAVVADQSKVASGPNLWTFRRIAARDLFLPGRYASDITLVNWPQMDYFVRPVIDVPADEAALALTEARELSLSLLYWLQTEAPRPDGGTGWPGLRLRGDVLGTADGFAQAPYLRESRRIRALTTIVEQDLSLAVRGARGAVHYPDSVGVGMYRIDLHPSTRGDNYLDVGACPFEIPLGALIPRRTTNLLAAAKNIGTTHITNGCYRLHPVEWNVGEAAGALASYCLATKLSPAAVHASDEHRDDFRTLLAGDGFELTWPEIKGY
ncbi:MAG TPA: FAD-dependent oxidoreductase [Micromonosporaceae bacterium]